MSRHEWECYVSAKASKGLPVAILVTLKLLQCAWRNAGKTWVANLKIFIENIHDIFIVNITCKVFIEWPNQTFLILIN